MNANHAQYTAAQVVNMLRQVGADKPSETVLISLARLEVSDHLMTMKNLFLHGWQSVPGGVKPTYLAQYGHTVISPKLPDDDFAAALAIAQAEYDKHRPDVIVGSSRGGAIAMNLGCGDTPLVLLCPAWKKYGTTKTIRANTTILHSQEDGVVPFADSEELVRNSGLPAYTLVETGSDHRLADPKSLEMMLGACLIGDDEPGRRQ